MTQITHNDKISHMVTELEWILSRIRACDGVQEEEDGRGGTKRTMRAYMLESVVEGKDYSAAEVHAWGKEEGCVRVYEKIRDLLRMRLITEPGLDKAIKLKHLAAFDGYVDRTEAKVGVSMVVNIMKEGAEL